MSPGSVAVVADDLTGAAEVAAVGWRRGLDAEVHTVAGLEPRTRLAVLDTDSRTRSEDEARKRSREAGAWLRARAAALVYKKVDSVLRGFVRAEVEEALSTLGWDRAILVPANPGLGRVVRDEQYFVGGRPVHETDFARDPQHPVRSSRVSDMLGGHGTRAVTIRRPGGGALREGLTLGEAASRADLMFWAGQAKERVLPVGAAEFFDALLEARGLETERAGRDWELPPSRRLFICGSSSERSRRWLEQARSRQVPVLSMPRPLLQGRGDNPEMSHSWARAAREALEASGTAALAIDAPPSDDPSDAGRWETLLVDAAEEVVRSGDVRALLVEGGATAAAVVRRFRWARLAIVREIVPGVVSLRADDPAAPLLTMKPGSYAWPEEVGG